MDEKARKKLSKFLSYVLRHHPELIDLKLDNNGWADTQELIQKATRGQHVLTFEMISEVVETNDKKRFSFSEDKSKIRANQGHSVLNIDLQLQAQIPPNVLYHGTVLKFLDSIKEQGLKKGSRQHVHLSLDRETATKVGSRRGKPIILEIDAKKMYADGYAFFCSENGVWLTEHVPIEYINFDR